MFLEGIRHDPVVRPPVREIRQAEDLRHEMLTGVGSPKPHLQPQTSSNHICKTSMPDDESFSPIGTVFVDLERLDVNLLLEEGSGTRTARED